MDPTESEADGSFSGAPAGDVFRALFEAYPDALIVAGADGRIVLANPAAGALLGYGADELLGKAIDVLVPDSIRPRHAEYRRAFGRDPRPRPMGKQTDLVAKRKDGSEVVVEIALSPLQDRGHPLVVAAIRDIGAYPRMKQALQRAHYSELLARVGRLAVDSRDPQALVDRVPHAAVEALQLEVATVYLLEPNLLELRIASMAGSIQGEQVGQRLPNRPNTSLGFVLAQGRSIVVKDYRHELRFTVPSHYREAGLISALAAPLSDQGRTIGVLVVRSRLERSFGDDEVRFLESLANLLVSSLQRVQSEEALSHAQRLESVGQLTGGIAHDFNNLLTVIQGNLQVLGDLPPQVDDAQRRPLVDAAYRATRRGAELTNKLLAFSRRQVLQPLAVDAAAMLRSLADMLHRTMDQRISIEVDVSPGDLNVLADPGQLESALLNIAINARDAMATGGTLRFKADNCLTLPDEFAAEVGGPPPGEFVAISVTDNGAGMTPEARERAFEPFFTTKEVGRGTGLGLSTVYGFVRQSKGAVTIDSVLGSGTTVTLYLPRSEASANPALSDLSTPGELRPGLAALLVEDDAEVQAVMRRFLEGLHCVVSVAASGEQALLMLEGHRRFDLLLTDIALGAGIRGTAVATTAQSRFPDLAIVLMSGYSAELLEADRDSPPAWELLRKPCTREELKEAIARVIGS